MEVIGLPYRRWWWLAAFAAVVVLAAVLRFRSLQHWALNNDEIFEATASSLPFPDMMRKVRNDAVHPPLDYLIQFGIARTHAPEWTRRLPSVLAGVATVALIVSLGWMWSSPAAGLIAGLLLAVSPFHIRYSQEVRPYSLALMFIAASLVALELHARSGRRPWAVLWCALVFLSASTLYFAGLVAGVTGIVRIFVERRTRLRLLWKWLPLVVLTWAAVYSPWFRVLHHVTGEAPPKGPDRLDWWWWKFRLHNFATGDHQYEPLNLGSWAFWAAVAIGTIASAWRTTLRPAVVWLFACGALQILVLQIRPHYSDPRYLMSSLPAAYVLAGAGVAVLGRRVMTMPFAAAALILFTGFSAIRLNEYYHDGRSDWRDILFYVHDRMKSGDQVVLANNWVMRNFAYYWMTIPEPSDIEIFLFIERPEDLTGPAWIVTGQCRLRPALREVGLMHYWPETEIAQVRYLRPGQHLSQREPLCPE